MTIYLRGFQLQRWYKSGESSVETAFPPERNIVTTPESLSRLSAVNFSFIAVEHILPIYQFLKMSVSLIAGLIVASIGISMRCVECRIKTSDVGTSKSQRMMSVHGRFLESIWTDLKDINKILNVIYPGTNWCGVGDVAKNPIDYGTSVETDKCCQEHDGCDIFITARGTKYNLTNTALYTVSGCNCDKKFLDCMVGVAKSESSAERDRFTANDFGKIFFNIIHPNCLVEDHPLVCDVYGLLGSCVESHRDTGKPKVWQFETGPNFPKL